MFVGFVHYVTHLSSNRTVMVVSSHPAKSHLYGFLQIVYHCHHDL